MSKEEKKPDMTEIYLVFCRTPQGSCNNDYVMPVFSKRLVAEYLDRDNICAYRVFTFPDMREVSKADIKLSLKDKE